MRSFRSIPGILLLIAVAAAPCLKADTASLSPRQIVERVSKGLVLIVVQDKKGEAIGQASGFFIEPGVIVTNLHVFKRASAGTIQILGGKEIFAIATVIGFDVRHDLALFTLKGKAQGLPLPLRAGSDIAVGDEILVGGNPQGLEGTFTKGIVSALRKDEGLVQIDAAVSPGSSGGPVVDLQARVIGVAATSLGTGQNLNFAIPSGFITAISRKWDLDIAQAGALMLTDREKDNLNGPVKTVQVLQSCTTFNKNGTSYRVPDTLTEKKTYDAKGYLAESATFSCGPFSAGAPLRRVRIEIDGNGFITRTVTAEKAGTPVEKRWSEKEALREKVRMAASDTVQRDTRLNISLNYDRSGHVTQQTWNNGDTIYTYAFDADGNTEEMRIFEGGKHFSTTRYAYEYDFEHNWIRQKPSHYLTALPDLGFVRDEEIAREITYY
jgi:hypothetical protein